MKLKYNDKVIELVYSFRANVYFEQIQNKNIDFANLSTNDLVILFYCFFLASLQKAKEPTVDMLTFLDIVDDNGGEKCISEFGAWLINVMQAQYEVIGSMEDTDKKPEANKDNNKQAKKKKA